MEFIFKYAVFYFILGLLVKIDSKDLHVKEVCYIFNNITIFLL